MAKFFAAVVLAGFLTDPSILLLTATVVFAEAALPAFVLPLVFAIA